MQQHELLVIESSNVHLQVIMAHLFGAGDREPLRHRLLPEDEYNNYGVILLCFWHVPFP